MKHPLRPMLAAAAIAAMAGCAAPAKVAPEIEREALEPLYCKGAEQCTTYWRRAQVWVAKNSRYKVQTATDALIVTFTSTGSSVDRSYQVTREPMNDGRELIGIVSGCANIFGCGDEKMAVHASFKRFVRGG